MCVLFDAYRTSGAIAQLEKEKMLWVTANSGARRLAWGTVRGWETETGLWVGRRMLG